MKGKKKMVLQKLRKGQTMVEYILIVCLIAIALIGVFMYFGKAIGTKAAGAADAISEQNGSDAKSEVDQISRENLRQLGE